MTEPTTEADARIVIDELLRRARWDPSDKSQVATEVRVEHTQPIVVAQPTRPYATGAPSRPELELAGRADYVLYGQNGRPLAVIEAKKNAVNPYVAKQQALPYAKTIGAPFIFLTNGELIYFWDYRNDDARMVASFFSRRDLERMVKTT